VIVVMAVVICLGQFGINTTSLAAVIGAAGLAIGLALQGSLTNIAAGVMLLIFRPFKVGDMIVANGQLAKVDEIELFFTRVDTPDNRRLIIPNSALFGTTVENITFHPHRRADIPVGVSYSADIDKTRKALERAVELTVGGLKDPAPMVFLKGFGASSVDWEVRVFAPAAEFGNVRQSLVRAIKIALDEAGISIPFPQMDVHLVAQAAAVAGGAPAYTMARPQGS
jgi:small conductance mechanosensitive channel